VPGLEGGKVQELFTFLLLRRQAQHREALADLLWGASAGLQGRKAVRQSLWQLQTALEQCLGRADRIVLADAEWVGLNPAADVWLDADVFGQAALRCQGVPGPKLSHDQAHALREAIDLYGDGLLAGCYQEWCLSERERFAQAYVAMLDKLMGYAEATQEYEAGLRYGDRILRCDRARERTHRRMMRLYVRSGDRTGALRQYQRCVAALREELDVAPAAQTRWLYDELRSGALEEAPADAPADALPEAPAEPPQASAWDVLRQLHDLGGGLVQLQQLIQLQQQRVQGLERLLRGH
jgi:DNA-binding SARP family transcriptional activator